MSLNDPNAKSVTGVVIPKSTITVPTTTVVEVTLVIFK